MIFNYTMIEQFRHFRSKPSPKASAFSIPYLIFSQPCLRWPVWLLQVRSKLSRCLKYILSIVNLYNCYVHKELLLELLAHSSQGNLPYEWAVELNQYDSFMCNFQLLTYEIKTFRSLYLTVKLVCPITW